MNKALVWVGPLYDHGGYGYVTRNYLRALKRQGFQVYCIPFGADHRSVLRDEELAELATVGDWQSLSGQSVPVIFHMDGSMLASHLPLVRSHLQPLAITPAREIAVSIFETHHVPSDWVTAFNAMDEVWVPSQFNRDTFTSSGVSPEKIRIVPYAIDTEFFRPEIAPTTTEITRMVYVFEFGFRKGLDLLLDAYGRAFHDGDPVELVLKTWSRTDVNILHYVQSYLFVRFGSTGRIPLPSIQLMTGPITQHGLLDLYRSSHLYVSTDRANGWGMPTMESMACGIPAIAIDWSGGTEFLHSDNGYPIPVDGDLEDCDPRLVEQHPFYQGQQWATVHPDRVRDVLRNAVSDPDRHIKAALARSTALRYSFAAVGQQLEATLTRS